MDLLSPYAAELRYDDDTVHAVELARTGLRVALVAQAAETASRHHQAWMVIVPEFK